MKNRKKLLLLGLFLALVTGGIFAVLKFRGQEQEIRKGAVDQPHLYLEQSDDTTQSRLELDLYVDTAGQETNGVDAIIDYDPEVLEFVSATKGYFFDAQPQFEFREKNGRVYIYSIASSPLTTETGKSKVAQIMFDIKKPQETNLSFVCDFGNLNHNSSAIWQGKEAINIIDCASLSDFTYIPSGEPAGELSPTTTGEPTVSLTPSPTGEPSVTPSPTKAPECKVDKDCRLSLCDCQCYPVGQTPEEQEDKLCGINCLGEYGIKRCKCVNNQCQEVELSTTPEPNKAEINFKVSLQGIDDSNAVVSNPRVKVIIKSGFSTVAEFSDVELIPDEEKKFKGKISLDEWSGNYTIYIKGNRHLSRKFCTDGQTKKCSGQGNISLVEGANEFDFSGLALQPGDILQSGQQSDLINQGDFELLKSELGSESSIADLDYNGVVHGRDIVLFLQTLETKYGDNI